MVSMAASIIGIVAFAEDVIQMSETRGVYIAIMGVTGAGKSTFIQKVTYLNCL